MHVVPYPAIPFEAAQIASGQDGVMHRHQFLTVTNTHNLVFVLSLSYNERSVTKVCYLASKSSPNTNATACFRSILMVDCLVCGWDMYEDNRFGAIRRTRRLWTFLFVGTTLHSSCSSPSAIRDLELVSKVIHYDWVLGLLTIWVFALILSLTADYINGYTGLQLILRDDNAIWCVY